MRKIIAGVMLFGLCACGGGGGGDAVAGGQGPAEPAPAPSAAAKVTRGPTNRDTKELCAFLERELSEAKDEAGSAAPELAREFAEWINDEPSRALGINTEIDELTSSSCPSVRSELLKAAGRDSLTDLLTRS